MMIFDGLSADQTKLKERVARLAKIRAEHPALRRGLRKKIRTDEDVWVFESRIASAADPATGDVVYVAINRSDAEKPIDGLPTGALNELVTGEMKTGGTTTIPPRQTRIFVAK